MKPGGLTLVVYGKGGTGKSTVCCHLAVALARLGRKVLLLGCDPKADTSQRLLGGRRPPTVVDAVVARGALSFDELACRARPGLDVIETGGPSAGQGCGGRSVATLCQFLERHPRELSAYDAMVFDVLGDLVCGGFVSPLRVGLGRDVYIVSSEEKASLFAANNIARVAGEPYLTGVSVGGLILNLRESAAPRAPLEAFAERVGLPIAAVLPRDAAILEAEDAGATVFDTNPRGEAAKRFEALAEAVTRRRGAVPGASVRPMTAAEFSDFYRSCRSAA